MTMAEPFFIKNREKLFSNLKDNSVAVLFAGKAPVKRGDEYYPFSPDRNFYYVSGIDRENCILLFTKRAEQKNVTLYIPRDNGIMAKWVGANMTPQEAMEISAIEQIGYIDQFEEEFADYVFKNNIETAYLDLECRDFSHAMTPALEFAKKIKQRFPAMLLTNVYPIFAQMREIKEDYEIQKIQQAIDITIKGIEEMMKHAKAGMMEYEIEAYFDFVLKQNGVSQKAFQTIAAAGKNGTILHYVKNNGKTKDGDLILFDVGAQKDWYNGDISRTFPVSGKFSQRQKQIYHIVLQGQQKVIDAIKPGVAFSSLNEILKEHYFQELQKIGLVQTKQEVSKYYYHNVSHYLGAETHDIGRYQEKYLKPNMVLTVEPGLYIEQWEIGIRIEDDVMVTEDGCCVLSQNMIKTVEEIETFMGKGEVNRKKEVF